MATIQQLKTRIENANELGRTNLSEKGVELSANATTYEIMSKIAEISGSGVEYTNIVYNEDNTITLTDKDGVIHTMSCTYEDGKLIGVTYDGKAVELTYNGDALVKVGKTVIDMGNAPVNIVALDHTVTFTVDSAPYQIVSVRNGNSVNAPSTEPTKEGLTFIEWRDSEAKAVGFPLPITTDTQIFAHFAAFHYEIEYYNANTVLGTHGGKTCSKANDGWSILGVQYNNDGYPRAVLVGLTAAACKMVGYGNEYYDSGSVEYGGTTYYFSTYKYAWASNSVTVNAYDIGVVSNNQEAALSLLKYYFND